VIDGVARIDQDRCNECEACVEACPNEAILVVIEPAEEKAVSLREQPASEVALAEPRRTPTSLRTRVVPAVGAALAFLGREVAPRLVTYLVDALDRQLGRRQSAATSSTNNLDFSSSGKSSQKGHRQRRRRRGK
jgi:ferredoxin